MMNKKGVWVSRLLRDLLKCILGMYSWNVFLEWMNLIEVAWGCLSKYWFSSLFGATPYYTISFSNVKWGRLMIVFPTDYKAFSLFTNPNLFLVPHKKIFKFLIHNIFITKLCIRKGIFTYLRTSNPFNPYISLSRNTRLGTSIDF